MGGQDTDNDDSSGDEAKEPTKRFMTRKESKALEREIPWRKVMQLPADQLQQYVEAARKEERACGAQSSPSDTRRPRRSWPTLG